MRERSTLLSAPITVAYSPARTPSELDHHHTTSDTVPFRDMSKENPYLAHLPPSRRGVGSGIPKAAESEPLSGFLPRTVTANQVRKALVRSTY